MSKPDRDAVLDAISERYETDFEAEDGAECDPFREALNDAYNAGLEAAKAEQAEAVRVAKRDAVREIYEMRGTWESRLIAMMAKYAIKDPT